MSLIAKYAFRACKITPVDDSVQVTGPCYSCEKEQSVIVPAADLERFRRGEFAQNCFSYLSAGEREFLISGICDACWNEMFPPIEEEDTPEE